MDTIARLVTDPGAWAALLALVVMEIVLGVDNLVFVAVLTNRLPEDIQGPARRIGLGLALAMRLALLAFLVVLTGLTQPLFFLFGHAFTARDVILCAGGLFLVWKATHEIHDTLDPPEPDEAKRPAKAAASTFAAAIGQIFLLDLVFSVDSILTAVGMTDQLAIMALAVIIAVGLMLAASGPLAAFIRRHPTVVMLALGFLLLIGAALIAEAFGFELPKGYIYAAMAFSAFVEGLNMLARRGKRTSASDDPPEE